MPKVSLYWDFIKRLYIYIFHEKGEGKEMGEGEKKSGNVYNLSNIGEFVEVMACRLRGALLAAIS
jgi:hypothetical protein